MENKPRIRTSVPITGIDTSSPNHSVADGMCESLHNLRFSEGAWRNVANLEATDIPEAVKVHINAGAELAYIHPINGKRVYITRRENTEQQRITQYYAIDCVTATEDTIDGDINIPSSNLRPEISIIKAKYYLDAPLSEVGKIPVKIYSKTVGLYQHIGDAEYIENGTLYYNSTFLPDHSHNTISLKYSVVCYANSRGEVVQDTLYFPVRRESNISANVGERFVFVKRGDNYIHFGDIIAIDGSKYTILDNANNIPIECNINSLDEIIVHLPKRASVNGGYLSYINEEDGSLFLWMTENVSLLQMKYGFGYFADVSQMPPRPKMDNGNYIFEDASGKEQPFLRESGELDSAYDKRLHAFLAENDFDQVFHDEVSFSLAYAVSPDKENEVEGEFDIPVDDIVSVSLSSLTNVVATPINDVYTYKEVFTDTTLTAFTDVALLNTFGSFGKDITIEHFGKMLIVRDHEAQTIYHYLFVDNKYETYGSTKPSLSFKVDVAETKASPYIIDVPMIYKPEGYVAGDGTSDMAMFVGAGEPIGGTAFTRPTEFGFASTSEEYFRGEFAIFVVARGEDGTELYRTTPQVVRSENILTTPINDKVLVFTPAISNSPNWETNMGVDMEAQEDKYKIDNTPHYNRHFLIWNYERLPKTISPSGDKNSLYQRYDNWKSRYKREDKYIKPILDNTRAADFYTIKVSIESSGENVYDYAIYTTRLHPLFRLNYGDILANDVKIMEEPFYRMKVLGADEREYIIEAKDFNNLETRVDLVYTPKQVAGSSFFARNGFEYNSAIHSYGISIGEPTLENKFASAYRGDITHILVSRDYDGTTYSNIYSTQDVWGEGFSYLSLEQGTNISFEGNLRTIAFGKMVDGKFIAVGKYEPEISYLNASLLVNKEKSLFDTSQLGVATGIKRWESTETTQKYKRKLASMCGSFVKYKPILLNNLTEEVEIPVINEFPVQVPNRIQVSETNNPLANPYERSYRIGSLANEIVAINSAAIEMSDSKFGEFPLYVFTREGIYAMQSGNESLYSAIIPVSKDVAINPNTLAVNGAIAFFSETGLHLLTNQGAQCISASIHEADGRIPDWMYTAKLVYLPEYKEVMCVLVDENGEATGKAYVYSLINPSWSERDVPQGFVMRNNEIVEDDCSKTYDLTNEGKDVAKEISLKTRPIKLGTGKELKRLETLVLRFESDKVEKLKVTINGSVDGVNFAKLREVDATTNKDVLIRRVPMSVKFLTIEVKGVNISSNIRIVCFDTEHYTRFERRLR